MSTNKNKEKRNIYKILLIIIFILLIILSINCIKYTNRVELTQLKDNTSRQMMGYILKTQNDSVILIDGGLEGDSQNLINNIQQLGGKVDYWFITHPHIDHMGAFLEIVKNQSLEIGKIYTTYNELSWYKEVQAQRPNEIEYVEEFMQILKNENIKNKVEIVTLNQKIQLDNINCEILGVANAEIINDPINNSSMVIKMKVNDKSIIFLADAGKESGDKLIKNQKDKLKANIVQMAHHGQAGVSEEVYKTIKPKICLWPTPVWLWNNDIGQGEDSGTWKTKETRKWMENLGVKQNIVEKDGDITIKVW